MHQFTDLDTKEQAETMLRRPLESKHRFAVK